MFFVIHLANLRSVKIVLKSGNFNACDEWQPCIFSFYLSGRSEENNECVEAYMRATKMFRDYSDPSNDPVFSEVRIIG